MSRQKRGLTNLLSRGVERHECRLNDNWSFIESRTVDASEVVESPSASDRSAHRP
jgi:hypothetical protein